MTNSGLRAKKIVRKALRAVSRKAVVGEFTSIAREKLADVPDFIDTKNANKFITALDRVIRFNYAEFQTDADFKELNQLLFLYRKEANVLEDLQARLNGLLERM